MAYKTCPDCGCRIFEYGCVNCNEEDYISMQGAYDEPEPRPSDKIKINNGESNQISKPFMESDKPKMMEKKTSVQIAGFWFHIRWENENEGYDQKGHKWLDKKNPHPADQTLIDAYLDAYNSIKYKVGLFDIPPSKPQISYDKGRNTE